MKELDQIVLLKGLFNKTVPLFEKWAREQSRMTGEGWIPLSRKLFLVSFVYIKKNLFFSKRALSAKHPITGRFIFLKQAQGCEKSGAYERKIGFRMFT